MPATEAYTYEWLDRVEASVEDAHHALVSPQRGQLPEFTAAMESACREGADLTATPAMTPRLALLGQRLTLLRFMLRQASAFAERQQLETGRILGYTPNGLERAL